MIFSFLEYKFHSLNRLVIIRKNQNKRIHLWNMDVQYTSRVSCVHSHTGDSSCIVIFLHSLILAVFQNYWNTCYLLSITFIIDRCLHSSAAMTPAQYKCDLTVLTGPIAKPELSLKIVATSQIRQFQGNSSQWTLLRLLATQPISTNDDSVLYCVKVTYP